MILLTPVRARFKKDIALRAKVLKRIKGNYKRGFEVILLGGPQGDLEHFRIIVKNLKKYSADSNFHLSLHCPIERKNINSEETDLTTENGLKTLEKTLNLAKAINARIVDLHIEKFYLGSNLLGKEISLKHRRQLQNKVKKGVIRIKRKVRFKGKIALENICPPMMADCPEYDRVEKMVFDPLLVTLKDCLYISEIKDNLGICLDICHYGLTKNTINRYLRNKKGRSRLRWGLLGLAKEDIEHQPDLVIFAEKLGNKLFSVHFADFKGLWIPRERYYSEGLVLGEGDYKEKELVQLWNYLKERNIVVNLEVKDRNLKTLNKTKRVINWINNH